MTVKPAPVDAVPVELRKLIRRHRWRVTAGRQVVERLLREKFACAACIEI
jgi:hypothetical protein